MKNCICHNALKIFLLVFYTFFAHAEELKKANYKIISISTGSVSGIYYPVGGAICRMVNKNIKTFGLRCSVETSSGSKANLIALNKNVNFAITQSDVAYNWYQEIDTLNDSNNKKFRSLFSLYNESFAIVVRAGSGIKSIDDIRGKRIGIGSNYSGSNFLINQLFDFLGFERKDFLEVLNIEVESQPQNLCSNKIDVMLASLGHPNSSLKEAANSCDVEIIPIQGDKINQFIKKYPYYFESVIKGGTYSGNPNDIRTFGTKAILVTSEEVSGEDVYKIVKSVFSSINNFRAMHPVFAGFSVEDMLNNNDIIQIHDGAKKYFIEAGLMFAK